VFSRHFEPLGGYFTTLDLARIALQESRESSAAVKLNEDEKLLRASFKRALEKPGSGFEPVEPAAVPAEIFAEMSKNHSHKQPQWWRKSHVGSDEPM